MVRLFAVGIGEFLGADMGNGMACMHAVRYLGGHAHGRPGQLLMVSAISFVTMTASVAGVYSVVRFLKTSRVSARDGVEPDVGGGHRQALPNSPPRKPALALHVSWLVFIFGSEVQEDCSLEGQHHVPRGTCATAERYHSVIDDRDSSFVVDAVFPLL